MARGNCRSVSPEVFFPSDGVGVEAARRICDSCPVKEPCLDVIDSLWTNRGGFFGTWEDDAVDCEYTYYALLAMGHLSL